MKKHIWKVVVLLVVLWMVPASGKAFTLPDGLKCVLPGKYTYEMDEATKTCTLIGFEPQGTVTSIQIPKEYGGYVVTKVAAGIFSEVDTLKEVIVFGDPEFLEEEGVNPFLNPEEITFYYEAGSSVEKVFQEIGGKLYPLSAVNGVKAKKKANLQSAAVSWAPYPAAEKYSVMVKTSKGYVLNGQTTTASFTASKLKAGSKQEIAVSALIRTVAGTPLITTISSPASVTLKPDKVKNFKASAGRGKIKLSWLKGKDISGYQIQRKVHINLKGFKSKFSHLKTVKGTKKTSITNVMLVSGMKYSYRIRTYKTVGKTKVYSDWVTINKKRAR